MRYELESMWALLSSMLLATASDFPVARHPRRFSPLVTVILIVFIIAAGVGIIYFLVVVPTTSSTYP